MSIILNFSFQVERKCLEADIHSMALRLASLTAAAALAVVCSAAINFAGGPGIGLDLRHGSPFTVVQMPAKANSGPSSLSANHTRS